jgi:hypothetical protein
MIIKWLITCLLLGTNKSSASAASTSSDNLEVGVVAPNWDVINCPIGGKYGETLKENLFKRMNYFKKKNIFKIAKKILTFYDSFAIVE